ncbi:MAG TPA: adenylate/guanylate cyclase domain-containing protein [Acidimicrobiales bacterium]|nr:adenylate/guanylate cyclase domain-containing protein [Acidimicrobiales bacterium]
MADDWEQTSPDIRVSNRDRDHTVERLRQNVTDGALTLDEFADRVGLVLAARTRGQLEAVVFDLPTAPAPVPERRTGRVRRWVVAVMSSSKAKGRWRVGKSVTALAVMGGCELDFRQAQIETAEVRVTAVAIMGGIDVIVPEGIAVELTGLSIMGGKHLKVADVPVLPGSPVITVQAFPIMGGVSVRSKPLRRQADPDLGEPDPAKPAPIELSEARQMASTISAGVVNMAPEGTVTVMFSDVAGYSEMNERLGDLAAHELLRAHNTIVREQVTSHGGQEVKSQGDGFMVAFPSATRAVRCAVAIQRALEKYAQEHPEEPVRVHVGLHTGEPIREGGDLLGRTVITASRLSDAAQPGEILVSALLYELANPTGEFRFGEPRLVELKGISGSSTVYPVQWEL